MSATRSRLAVDEVALELRRIGPRLLAACGRDFPQIPHEDLENAFGDVTEAALTVPFGSPRELASWAREALWHDALDIVKSAGFRASSPLSDAAGTAEPVSFASPEEAVVLGEARELLHEFLGELSDTDRRIAYLHLDPDYTWTPKAIAAALGISRDEVESTLDRIGARLRRFRALYTTPEGLCKHRLRDLARWRETARMPLALKMHLRRCHRCRCEIRYGQEAVRGIILPLIPAGTLPIASTAGPISRLFTAASSNHVVHRVDDVVVRWRRIVPAGGGGAAVVAVKIAATTAVVATSAAISVISTSQPPKPHHRQHQHRRVKSPSATRTITTASAYRHPTVSAPTAQSARSGSTSHNAVRHITRKSTRTGASGSLPPAPNYNPAPARSHEAFTARAASGSASSSAGGSGSGSSAAASAPAPNTNSTSTSNNAASSGGSSSSKGSSLPVPGGPPPP